MKPANFPERVNQRRMRALERCGDRVEHVEAHPSLASEIASLRSAIAQSARDVRTKKHLDSSASAGRKARHMGKFRKAGQQ